MRPRRVPSARRAPREVEQVEHIDGEILIGSIDDHDEGPKAALDDPVPVHYSLAYKVITIGEGCFMNK